MFHVRSIGSTTFMRKSSKLNNHITPGRAAFDPEHMCAVGSVSLEKPAHRRFKTIWSIAVIGVPLFLYGIYLHFSPDSFTHAANESNASENTVSS